MQPALPVIEALQRRLVFARREWARGINSRAVRVIGDGERQPVEERVEFCRRRKIHRLRDVILRPVIADLIPLAVAPLRLRVRIVAEDEADGRYMNAEKG